MTAQQRVTLGESFSNNQGDRMAHSVGICQLLSTDTPVITQWVHEKNTVVTGVGDMQQLECSSMGLLLTKAKQGIDTAKCIICWRSRPKPKCGILPRVISKLASTKLITFDYFHCEKDNIMSCFSGYGLAYPE